MIARSSMIFALVVVGCTGRGALAQSPAVTSIEVALPVDAQLWVNGRLTTSTGDRREFRDSQSLAGSVYRYDLRAVVNRDGREVSQQQLVRLIAGSSTRVTFEFPNSTTALKPTQSSDYLLVQDNSLRRNQFQQPRPETPTTESELPDVPALGAPSGDRFRLRQPELGDPTDNGVLLPQQPELPDLDNPTDSGNFGRQYGDEPDATLGGDTPNTSDLAPPVGSGELPEPEPSTDETRWKMQPSAPSDYSGAGALGGANEGQPKDAADDAGLSPWLAYICGNEQHHLTGNTGTALHIWQHRWRMVRLQRTANLGPFLVYDEVGHPGNQWAYGPRDACRQSPVFFKHGANSRWQFVGSYKRVRPFTN